MALNSPTKGIRGAQAPMAEINVTPLVDVMLVLLVIFMVSAPLLEPEEGAQVDVPKVKNVELDKGRTQPLVVTVDRKGRISILKKTIAMDRLSDVVAQARKTTPDQKIFLRADENVRYGVVMAVMSEIRQAGVEDIGMVTEDPDGKKARR